VNIQLNWRAPKLGILEILAEELGVAHIANSSGHGTELVSIGTGITAVVGIGKC
jgi:hypothetical protein